MKVYISGKISGLDFEDVKTRFSRSEEFLTSLGVEAVNPLKNGLSVDDEWIKHLCKDLEMLHDCDSIYLMEGWYDSTGACIEYDFALRTGKTILFESNIVRNQGVVLKIEAAIHEVMGLRLSQYKTKSRKRDCFFARMLFVYHCRREKMKLTDIAKYVYRDHSSMFHFLNKYNDEVRFNPFFRSLAERVNDILKVEIKELEQ